MELWLYPAAFLCAAITAWTLLPKPSPQMARLLGAKRATPVARLIARLRGKPIAMQAPELPVFGADIAPRRMEESKRGLFSSILVVISRLLPVSEGQVQQLNGWLSYLGSGMTAREFAGLRVISAVGWCMAAVLLVPQLIKEHTLMLGLAALIGFSAPEVWLKSRVSARHKAILRLLPEVIDLLALCMGAGLDFLGALNRVVAAKAGAKKKEPLLEELSVVIQEIKFGKRRGEALKAMSKRVNLAELSSFVRTLVQADRMGTPIGEVLAIHSEDVRFQRFQRAERAVLKAPIKILVPLIFCILPCVGIIVAAPIFLQFSNMKLFN